MNNEVAKREERRNMPRFTPNVDLMDRKGSFELRADMPGVRNEDLNLNVEDYVLHLSGLARSKDPEGYRSAKREFGDCEYRIAYRLSPEIDLENIQAKIDGGVLSVKLPKREEHQPRKIEVEVE